MFEALSLDFQGRHFSGNQVVAFGSITLIATLIMIRRFVAGGKCSIKKNLTGKVAVITGGNTGIGKETTRKLAEYGCKIIIGARDVNKNGETVNQIKKQYPETKITSARLDLGDRESINNFSQFVKNELKNEENKIDYLINNAGVMAVPERRLTKDGYEMTMGINHFGHFYLTYKLWNLIHESNSPRIINLSSSAHAMNGKDYQINMDNIFFQNGGYAPWTAYSASKLANILFTKQLQRRMDEKRMNGISVSVHPGVVRTELTKHLEESLSIRIFSLVTKPLHYLLLKSPTEGAQTNLQTVLEDEDKLKKGEYYKDCKVAKIKNRDGNDPEAAKKLWKKTEEILGIQFNVQ